MSVTFIDAKDQGALLVIVEERDKIMVKDSIALSLDDCRKVSLWLNAKLLRYDPQARAVK